MCTLTIVPMEGAGGRPRRGRPGASEAAYRVAFNRDEARARPAALPPQVRRHGARLGAMPIDPLSGGTWIGVNDAGLTMALLNANHEPAAAAGSAAQARLSRGLIVPSLLGAGSLAEAASGTSRLDAARFAPFTLFLADGREILVLRTGGSRLVEGGRLPADRPRMLTSSGLGDLLVAGPRSALFERMLRQYGRSTTLQDRFHRHSWPDRPEVSVCMRRADARTVSFTVVEVLPEGAILTYYPDPPDVEAEPTVARLPARSLRAA